MALPVKAIAKDTVLVDGTAVDVRGLSRSEALHFSVGFTGQAMPDTTVEDRMNAAEVYVLTQGTGCSEQDAIDFRNANDTEAAGAVLDRILELSGLTPKKAPADGEDEDDPKA